MSKRTIGTSESAIKATVLLAQGNEKDIDVKVYETEFKDGTFYYGMHVWTVENGSSKLDIQGFETKSEALGVFRCIFDL